MTLASIPQSQIYAGAFESSGIFLLFCFVYSELDQYKINLWLSGDITICSNHRRNTENIRSISSTQRKGYFIRKSTRRNLIASAFFLFLKKKNGIVFLTLTFNRKIRPNERINPLLNKFLTNLRINYGLENYIWTRENQKNGRPHYHILADLPYIPIQKINSIWCKIIDSYSGNAVRLPKHSRAIVNDLEKSVKYISKYITKDQNEVFKERCYAISSEVKIKPIRINYFDFKTIHADHKKDMKFRVYEHCTTVKIWDFFKKSDYFIGFLGNYTETSEIHSTQERTVKNFECRGRQEGINLAGQFSLFNSG